MRVNTSQETPAQKSCLLSVQHQRQAKGRALGSVWDPNGPRWLQKGYFTSAHPSVFSEGVSRWTSALVGAKGVDAAEGTEQGIQCTFVNIWEAGERGELDSVL